MKQRLDAASYGTQDVRDLSKQLETVDRVGKLIPESEEETSRAVEMYDMVSPVTLRPNAKTAMKQEMVEEIYTGPGIVDIDIQATTVQDALEVKSGTNEIKVQEENSLIPDNRNTSNKRMMVSTEAINHSQDQHPFMKAMKDYVQHQQLPAGRLEKVKILESAPFYEVSQSGMLCRIRERRGRGSLGVTMQVLVPPELRGELIAGCHEDTEGHASGMKTFQKPRDRFYWPGMLTGVHNYLQYCAQCQLAQMVKLKAPIKRHI